MFKEFGLLFICFVAVTVIFRKIYRKNCLLFKKVIFGSLILLIAVNTIYNLRYVFPTFVYEQVPIGDSRENLFAYKDDSDFPWQILNTVIRNRTIGLDKKGELYEPYFSFFAKDMSSIECSSEIYETLEKRASDFSELGALDMVKLLPYAFPTWERGPRPILYLNVDSLKGNENLVGIIREREGLPDLYVMSEAYYRSQLGGAQLQ